MKYQPDKWKLIKIVRDGREYIRILSSWYGGYTGSNSWRLSSAISKAWEETNSGFGRADRVYCFETDSGSQYRCIVEAEGMSAYTSSVFSLMQEGASKHSVPFELINMESKPVGVLGLPAKQFEPN